MGKAVMVAGIGCRTGVGADAVLAAVDAALEAHALPRTALGALATAAFKAQEAGIVGAAGALGLRLIAIGDDELKGASARGLSQSTASLAATGIASVSEAAALAAAGEGSRLLGPRIARANVTCAIAQGRSEA
jgi:cobalt-precorrin 5A hydrolase